MSTCTLSIDLDDRELGFVQEGVSMVAGYLKEQMDNEPFGKESYREAEEMWTTAVNLSNRLADPRSVLDRR